MAERGVGHAALHVGHRRERRIHDDDARHDGGVEVIVNLRGVLEGHADVRKQQGEDAGAGLGQFVEDERSTRDLRKDGEQANAGRRLQHAVGRRDRGGSQYREAEPDRRRELLVCLALQGAARVCRQEPDDLLQHGERLSRRAGLAQKRLPVFAEKQNGCCLAGVVGCLPVPGAGRIGAAEGLLHCATKDRRVDLTALFEVRKKELRGRPDAAGDIRRRSKRRDRDRRRGRESGGWGHVGEPLESGNGRAGRRSLWTAPAQTRPGQALPLVTPLPSQRATTRCAHRASRRR